ncbi:hypothetical protein H8D36_03375 [archaeon]|nr:hypothetical protein [archaeon]
MERLKPHLDRILDDIDGEEWRDVFGYDGYYQVSNFGRVKSLRRLVNSRHGGRWVNEKIMAQGWDKCSSMLFSKEGTTETQHIPNLVADAFLRERKPNEEICHLNKLIHDSRLENLKIMPIGDSQKINYELGIQDKYRFNKIRAKFLKKHREEHFIYSGGVLVAKICKECKRRLLPSDYYEEQDFICKKCRKEKEGTKEYGKNLNRGKLAGKGFRKCHLCGETKSLTEFYNCKRNPFGKTYSCKKCQLAKRKAS